MKNKLFSIFTALAMVLGILVSPFTSAHAVEATETKSVTIHKILLSKKQLEEHDKDKKYNGKEITDLKGFFAEKWKEGDHVPTEIDGVYFKLQKLNEGVADTDIDVNDDTQWSDIEGKDGKTADGAGLTLDTTSLSGKFRIVEDLTKSTYKGDKGELLAASKAVPTLLTLPIRNNDGVVENAHVYPKNTQEKPKIDKNFSVEEAKKHITEQEAKDLDAAIQHKVAFDNAKKAYAETTDEYKNAEADYTAKDKELIAKWGIDFDDNQRTTKQEVTKKIGDDVKYVVETEIPKDAKYKKLVWTDQMTKGLTYNKDLEVKLGTTTLAENTDYKVINTDRGFTLKFTADGMKKVEEAAKTADQTITLKYSAKVNEKSIVDKPDANDVAFDYSNKPGKDSEPEEGQPKDQKIKVVKDWAVDGQNEITEADKNVKALFTLQEKQTDGTWKDVDTHEVTAAEHFEYEFTGLDDTKTYRVIEQVSGYEPEYVSMENGVTTIKNEKDSTNPKTLNPSEPKVVTGGKRFVKTNNEDKGSDKLERLAGAEFWIKNNIKGDPDNGKYLVAAKKDADKVTKAKKALDDAVTAYNNLTAEEQEGTKGTKAKNDINTAQEAYNKAFKENAIKYTWGDKEDPNVVVLTSDAEGRFEIAGLEYKEGYELEEKTAPEGFAKLQSNESFEIKKGSYDGEASELDYKTKDENNQDVTKHGHQVRNKNVTIPQTGGIGSLIFVVAGLAIMAGAYAAYRKSQARA